MSSHVARRRNFLKAAAVLSGLCAASCSYGPGSGAPAPAASQRTDDLSASRDPRAADGAGDDPMLLPETYEDLLVQDVCATADGRLLAADPYDGCPSGSTRRDLRIGEPLPYHRHDQPGPGAPQGYQRHDSFPRPGAGTGTRYVHPFDFAPFGEYNPDHDGYDVVEADGSHASIIGTRDPVGLAQTFFGPGCALDDSWLLFPTSGYAAGGSKLAQLILVGWERAMAAYPGRCPARYDQSYTSWQRRTVDFGGVGGGRSKRIEALVVDHYGGGAIATADHIERFYFTRIYGLTRWERWQRTGTPRAEGCSGPTSEAGFVRLDCRDWTHVIADPSPYPTEAWPTPYAQANLVENHDFGGRTVSRWERLGKSTAGAPTNWSIISDADGAHLATNCAGSCSPGQCIFQDVPRRDLGGSFRFGGRFWAEGGSGALEFVVFQRDKSATILERHSVPITAGATPVRVVSPAFPIRATTDHLRITVYLNAPNTFHFDDVFLARSEP